MRKDIYITRHAREKYEQEMEWVFPDHKISNTIEEVLDLYRNARREKLGSGLVKRVMKNNFEETKYYKNDRWRMVVCNDSLVTIEIDSFNQGKIGLMKNVDKSHRNKRWLRRKAKR